MLAHKNQYKVEHIYKRSKSEYKLEPIYLQSSDRIEAYLFLFKIALQVLVLMEKLHGLKSPAERLNKFRYHDNWLHNLYVSASLGGYRRPPLNAL